MSEERIDTGRDPMDEDQFFSEELDAIAGGVMEQFGKHSEEVEK